MSFVIPRALIVLALAALVASGCDASVARTASPVIDTWPVGAALGCSGPVDGGSFVPASPAEESEQDADVRVIASCRELVREALRGLAARDQGHAAITSVSIHREGTVIDSTTGKEVLFARSGGCCYVLVADLEDGSRRAIGVGYPGISMEPMAVEWETGGGQSPRE